MYTKKQFTKMKHLKTQKQLNESSENLNISDVISRLSNLNRYKFIVNYDADNATLSDKKDKNGEYVKWEDIQKILNDL